MKEIKIVTRGKRSPRKYKPIRSVSLCDRNGEIVASISLGPLGIHVDYLEGFPVRTKEMNALGQYRLDDEPDIPFNCPHCGESWARKWVGSGPTDASYRVVCKGCGKGVI